jgi:hypothetical protein
MTLALSAGAQMAVATVFVAAIVEKASILGHGSARWHPIFITKPQLRPYAGLLVSAALLGDTLVVLTVLLMPALGAVIGSAAVILYSVAAVSAHNEGESCACLWRFGNSRTRPGLIARNSLIIVLLASTFRARWDGVSIQVMAIYVTLVAGVLFAPVIVDRWAAADGAEDTLDSS